MIKTICGLKGTGKTKREAEQRAAKEACVLFDVKWDI